MGDAPQNDMEKLFLLEVLVDSLSISNDSIANKNLDKNVASNLADTCVMFQFLHYPPLVVCESDFIGTAVQSSKDSSQINFKCGKSCFFSLRSPKGPILPVPFEVKVSVIRKMKEGVLPDKLVLGKTTIDMGESFTELLKQNTDENCDALPLSKTKKGSFIIQDDSGKNVGGLTAFLRISCFGKLIITQFSLNKEDEKSYLFKGTDMAQVCRDRAGKDEPVAITPDKQEGFSIKSFQAPTQRTSTLGYGASPTQEGRPAAEFSQSERERKLGFEPANLQTYGPSPTRSLPPTRGAPPRLNEWDRSQVEVFDPASVATHGYTAPMPTMFARPPSMGASPYQSGGMYPSSMSSSPRGGGGRLCDCAYPVPPSVMSKYTQRMERNLDLAPGEVGLQDDQVIFQLPLKKQGDPLTERDQQIDSQVYYKLTSAEETKDGTQKNTVNIKSDDVPGMATKGAVSPVSGLPVDDGHDVFLLKIGKKCDGDKKRNLELELRTPKMKEPKPPMSDKDTQYLESDIPKPSKTTSGKKGSKGGKGGKGGKKGKKK